MFSLFGFVLQDTQLITEIIKQMICSPDPELGGDNQLMEILRALIDPEKMQAIVGVREHEWQET